MVRSSILAAGLLCLAACQLNAFDSRLQAETTVPSETASSATLLTAMPFGGFDDLDFDHNPDFENQGVTKDQINSAEITSFVLEILSPPEAGFGFLDQVEVYAHAGDDEVLVASKYDLGSDSVDPSSAKLALDVTETDLTSFIAAPKMSLEVRTEGHLPPKDTRIRATANLRLRVQVYY